MAKEEIMRNPNYDGTDRKIAVYQYAKFGSALSTAFRMRQRKTARQILFDAMYGEEGTSKSRQRKRQIKEVEGDPDKVRELFNKFWLEDKAMMEKVFGDAGINGDLSSLTDVQLSDPAIVAPLINAIAASRATRWDKVHELRRNFMLSGIGTHAWNLASTTMNIIFKQVLMKGLSGVAGSGLNLAGKGITLMGGKLPEGYKNKLPTISELGPMYMGMWRSIGDAGRAAAFAWKYEMPRSVFEEGGISDAEGITGGGVAISGRKGRLIRIPQRGLLASA